MKHLRLAIDPDDTRCAWCGLPVEGNGVRLGNRLVHGDLVHCDQLTEVADAASFLESLLEEHDAAELKIHYGKRPGKWCVTAFSNGYSFVQCDQREGESLAALLLRASGGLLKTP